MTKATFSLALLLLLQIGDIPKSLANTAYPGTITELQSDGKPINLILNGDEFDNFYSTPEGYTVLRNDSGDYVYANQNGQGFLVPTGIRVDSPAGVPPGLAKKLRPSPEAKQTECQGKLCGDIQSHVDDRRLEESRQLVQTTGTLKNLVVLIRFSDHASRALPTQEHMNILMNNRGPHATYCPTGSVWNVYNQNSYGRLDIASTISPWVTVPNTQAYYANGGSGLTTRTHDLIHDALNAVDPFIDFRAFDGNGDGMIDAITFIHSGYASEAGGTDAFGASPVNRIWSHKWSTYTRGTWRGREGVGVYDYNINPGLRGISGSGIGRIGVIAHELGHFLGLPDLYDGSGGSGIGSFCLMANSW
jgi:M6 family metalloprotease-like protein